MRHLFQLLLTASLLITAPCKAGTGHLFTPDKLSSGLITCICQDRYGYIWIGTEYGLNKFDGYRYTAYHHSRKDSMTISNNEIASLFVDREGRLWVGCSKGLSRYDYEHDNFIRYTFPDNRHPRVSSVCQTPEGDLLFGTAGYGLFSLRKGSHHILYEDAFCKRNLDDFCSRIHIDRQGNLWRSSHLPTITRFSVKDKKPVSIRDYQTVCGHPLKYIEYSEEKMLIVCLYGMMSYSYRTGELQKADFDLSLLDRNVSIRKACVDRQGNIYIVTAGCGLMVIPKGERTLQYIGDTNTKIDLNSANVVDVMEDKDQNLWAACYNKGLIMIPKQEASFNSWSFSDQHYVTDGNVTSIVAGEGDDIWCTVQNNGIYRLDHTGRIIGHPVSPAGTRIIYRDRNGKYWLTTENTLYRFYPKTGRAVMERTFDGRGLNCMVDDGQGRLYICVFGMGLCVYDTNTREIQMFSMQQTDRSGGCLCNDWIKAMTFDSRGMLWICTTNGIAMMNPQGFVFNGRGRNTLLKGLQCYAVCETKDGDMLIGTEAGLYRYDWKRNQMTEDAHARPLTDKMICSMVKDNQGDVWISTTNGIWHYADKQKQILGYVGGNGLTTKEYILGASLHLENDKVFFGTADGITTFLPHDINKQTQQLGKVFLTRFFCNGSSLNPMEEDFQLVFNDNTFTLEFSLLDYQNTDNIAFQYRINGGKTWMQTHEGGNQITFTQLPPGQYTVEVRAASNGIYSKSSHILHITILKPWYKSWWAYLFYGTVAAGFLLLILFNIDRQRRRNLEENKMQFLINATHDIRSPLTLIMGPLEKLKQRIHDPVVQTYLNTIDKSAKRLMLLVNQILDERKIDKHKMKLLCTKTNLNEFIRGIWKLYEYHALQRHIIYRYECPDEPVSAWIDHIQFDKIIDNLLSNAFKFTTDYGEITVRLSHPPKKHFATIEVIDNGTGFEDAKTELFFKRFYQGRSPKGLPVCGTGIGLNLCRALTEMHGGKISAANRSDGQTGAILTIQLPMGNRHLKPEEMEENKKINKTPGEKKQATRNFKILIVDDDPEIATYIMHELCDWYKFDYAPNGREALKLLLTKPYDLVVSDVMMPEMDGITLLKNIKSNMNISDIPVILLTSKSEVAFRLEGLKKGANAFLAKPFSMEELHVQIDNLVDNTHRLKGKYTEMQVQKDKEGVLQVKGNDDAMMEKVMLCIRENLSDADFNIEQLAENVGMSRTHLYRTIKRLTGFNASEFLRNIRLEQAARLIKEKKVSVSQVAYTVGFNSQSHFSMIFKKHFGVSPTTFLEENKEINNQKLAI